MRHNIHLGVTGLRRTGKTVFLTSLIYQLTELGSKNLGRFSANGVTLRAATLKNSKNSQNNAIKLFPFRDNLECLRKDPPQFPLSTTSESECVLSFYYDVPRSKSRMDQVKSVIGLRKSQGRITLHLHDYPGEYLLDVGLINQTYNQWSQATLARMRKQCLEEAGRYGKAVENMEGRAPDEIFARLRESYGDYVSAAQKAGMEFVQPGRSLIKWDEKHGENSKSRTMPSPEELPFVPLPQSLIESSTEQTGLVGQMISQYNRYVDEKVKPFIKRIQRCRSQLVLVDVLRILRNGVDAHNDTRDCITEILRAYHEAWQPFRGVRKVQFAATKADHATKNYRANMTRLLDDLVDKAKGPIKIRTPIVSSEWFTSLRSTQDALIEQHGKPMDVLKGVRIGSSEEQAFNPGLVPSEWPDDEDWTYGNAKYDFPEWQPKRMPKRDGSILPHMNFDKVLWEILESCF